jgi:diguanylate cyclase (GGDEF)-like protein
LSSGYARLRALIVRRAADAGVLVATAVAAWLVSRGFFINPHGYRYYHYIAIVALAVAVLVSSFRSVRPLLSHRFRKGGLLRQIEVGTSLVTASMFAAQASAGSGIDMQPLPYLMMVFVAYYLSAPASITCLVLAFAVEWGMYLQGSAPLFTVIVHCIFLAMFFALFHLLHLSETRVRRLEHRAEVERHIREIEEKALGYRLVSSRKGSAGAPVSDGDREQMLSMSGVLVIKKALTNQLEVARAVLHARTVAIFMLDDGGRRLKMIEAVSDSDKLRSGVSIPAGEGVMGAVISGGKPVVVDLSRQGQWWINWYSDGEDVGAAVGVPMSEEEGGSTLVRGLLVADREVCQLFTPEETGLLTAIASEAMHTLSVEKIVLDMDREKNQKEKFYAASRRLGEALTLDDVLEAVVDAARTVRDYDFVAVTLVTDEQKMRQKVASVSSRVGEAGRLTGADIPDEPCLVASVVKLCVPLPSRDFHDMEKQEILPPRLKLRDLESVKIVPLMRHGRAIGTIIVALSRRHHFDGEEMGMLLTVGSLAAIAIENGKLYAKMEEMATTDGLTGLYNHRSFQERMDEAMARAKRSGVKLSVILMDIDHFKKVNDTYGHPEGDKVLKGVAAVLRKGIRAVDFVARYGGEEFAVIMEGTDRKGAMIKAERIRTDVKAGQYSSEQGRFSVTISLGIATWPEDAADKKELILRSDEALYQAKHEGRDRCVAWGATGG